MEIFDLSGAYGPDVHLLRKVNGKMVYWPGQANAPATEQEGCNEHNATDRTEDQGR